MPTFRQINAVRNLLNNALTVSSEDRVTGALIQAIDELDDMLIELVRRDNEHEESSNALLAHVSSGMTTMAVI